MHLHTQYSILDGAAKISTLMEKVQEYDMHALAVTDHGNMFGALDFLSQVEKVNKSGYQLKPIIGCEIYVAPGNRFEKKGRQDRSGYHLILLAKNKNGYHNLAKLVSLGYLEGFYYTPRIDKELLRKYGKDLIAMSACLGGEIPETILERGEEKAESVLMEYLDIFGDDFYLELMRHGLSKQDEVNEVLLRFSKKFNVKVVATNDVHFVNEADYKAHQILICLNTNRTIEELTELVYTGKEYFRPPSEMQELFADVPEAITTTEEIVNKIETYDLKRKIILPTFPIPQGFGTGDDYLRHLTLEGAKRKYGEINDETRERIEFELEVIKNMGYAGYFLIVQDLINEARKMGVFVGPGRGSAAGSAVAYCIGITNVDPIKYNLLFERFLNPERISMPDIDIDFDDEGRDLVLKYVVEKYGKDKVAQIVTFGTMAAKSSIRDVARVLKLPLPEADRLAKLVPEGPKVDLKKSFSDVTELREARKSNDEKVQKTLAFAEVLEGSARHTGLHACGVIIGPEDLIEHIPLCTAKDSELRVTQYEGEMVESVGMLKMDFLGLKTLSIMKDAIHNIKKSKDIDIDLDLIDLEDKKTFELFQKGRTFGVFQFESDGMRNHLKELKPNNIEDLIAMNALYRPGPMNNIPNFISRKHGQIKVEYPHPLIENILKNTLGIMVYQEQIMQISQALGGFSKGQADELRKAMGKKKLDIIERVKVDFISGASEKGIPRQKAEEIYDTMSKFGEYGFNRSHSAAYSIIAFQTAFLKAHYPAEFMAAILTHNLNDIKEITKYIEECKRSKIKVIGPDINESEFKFTVNKHGEIRFGLGAIKNLGEAAVEAIITERDANGAFTDIFDFTARVNLRSVNKKSIESLVYAGAFDGFENTHRAQYFFPLDKEGTNTIDKAIKYGNKIKEASVSTQVTLFGESELVSILKPALPNCEPWPKYEILKNEKDFIGFFVSGHPLDDYKIEFETFCNTQIIELKQDLTKFHNKNVKIGGMVTEALIKTDKSDNRYASFIIEDYTDSIRLFIFREKFQKFKHFMESGLKLFVQCTVIPRFRDARELTIDVREISMMSEIRDKMLNTITFHIDLQAVSKELVDAMLALMKEFKGNCQVRFHLIDIENKMKLDMFSGKFRINPTNEFFEKLAEFPEIRYRLN